jgi:hypothetical protein
MKSGKKASRDKRRPQHDDSQNPSANQGEGDRKAARRFNDAEREFVESDEGQEAIRKGPAPDTADDEAELRDAEVKAGRRARENDPEEKRDHRRPAR